MTDESIRFLVEQKISYLNTVANVTMLWWVSSVVFCSSILAAVWSKRGSLKSLEIGCGMGLILFTFFSSIVAFGIAVFNYTVALRWEISKLALELGADAYFSAELKTFSFAMVTGTSSFVLVWLFWVLLWCYLWGPALLQKVQSAFHRRQAKPAEKVESSSTEAHAETSPPSAS